MGFIGVLLKLLVMHSYWWSGVLCTPGLAIFRVCIYGFMVLGCGKAVFVLDTPLVWTVLQFLVLGHVTS